MRQSFHVRAGFEGEVWGLSYASLPDVKGADWLQRVKFYERRVGSSRARLRRVVWRTGSRSPHLISSSC